MKKQNMGELVAENITLALKKRKLTQKALSCKTGITHARIQGIASGTRIATLDEIQAISNAMTIPMEWFVREHLTELNDWKKG